MQYLLVIILVLIVYLYIAYIRRFYLNYLINLLKDQEYHRFKTKLKHFITPLFIEPFIIDLLGFNCAILENDKHSIEVYLDIFTKRNLKEHERIEIYTKAFKYFLLLKDRNKIEEYYLLLKTYNLKEIEELYSKYKDSI